MNEEKNPLPVARGEDISQAEENRKPVALKGVLQVGPEFFEPLPPDELADWE